MVDVRREVAEATRPELGSAYSGCVDQFERGMSSERVKEVFDELKTELVPLLKAIQSKVRGCTNDCVRYIVAEMGKENDCIGGRVNETTALGWR